MEALVKPPSQSQYRVFPLSQKTCSGACTVGRSTFCRQHCCGSIFTSGQLGLHWNIWHQAVFTPWVWLLFGIAMPVEVVLSLGLLSSVALKWNNNLFIHSLLQGHLDCFQLLSTVNAAMDIQVFVCVCGCVLHFFWDKCILICGIEE